MLQLEPLTSLFRAKKRVESELEVTPPRPVIAESCCREALNDVNLFALRGPLFGSNFGGLQ